MPTTEMLSPHFALIEMTISDTAARNGIDNTPPAAEHNNLVRTCAQLLEPLRGWTGSPIIVTSGFRCFAVNELVGGAGSAKARAINPNSQPSAHQFGMAADIHCPGYKGGDVRALCQLAADNMDTLKFDQCIYEFSSWCHIAWAPIPRGELWVTTAQDGIYSRVSSFI